MGTSGTNCNLKELAEVLNYSYATNLGSADLTINSELVEFMNQDKNIVINEGGAIYTCDPTSSKLPLYKSAVKKNLNKEPSILIVEEELISKSREVGLRKASQDAELTDDQTNRVETMLNDLVEYAHGRGASDIHIRLGSAGLSTELRENSFLMPHEKFNCGYEEGHMLFTHLLNKAKASLGGATDLSKILNGAFDNSIASEKFRFRVSFQPLTEGLATTGIRVSEAVIRILPPVGESVIDIYDMNLPPDLIGALKRAVSQKSAGVIIGGPTGSGKTTLAHAVLGLVQDGRKINTIEDPVEIINPRFRQAEIVRTADKSKQANYFTFSDALKNMLRQDSDVVLVGEVRDNETARTACQVAINGHVLLASVHIDRVSSTFEYLHLNMGLLPVQIASESFSTVWLCQRLATRVCPNCAISYADEEDGERKAQATELMGLFKYPVDAVRFRNPEGCDCCREKGAYGLSSRIPVVEFIELDQKCREFIEKSKVTEMVSYLRGQGWQSMAHHASFLIANGLLDVETATLEVGALSPAALGEELKYTPMHLQDNLSDLYQKCTVCPKGD
ncbi:Flp pilus assembly complex ATPase component TadA [Vibrio tubiashii]|uniref:GspE/PulE family protein n=1 Tax=Vibrio tubiashii TaxID=29498 RepID=UPI001EFE4BE7|nr:ATPase, T2SS/T4P/T4SS family [Vibrio tubiashii]MCG9576718.1 Flp pilus assembly complex ATPase component TadA [Vibrio tubiashii]